MPQKYPMSWVLIYLGIITTFLMFIVKLYFTKSVTIKQKMNSMKSNNKNLWK